VYGPLGAVRDDMHMAVLASLIYNAFAAKGKSKEPEDFMPQWDQRKEYVSDKIRRMFGG
jgi:hypothetical protein